MSYLYNLNIKFSNKSYLVLIVNKTIRNKMNSYNILMNSKVDFNYNF